jgi:hypothetical protein
MKDEVKGKLIKRVQEESYARGSMIVTGKLHRVTVRAQVLTRAVAACTTVRQDLLAIVQKYVEDNVELVELDYQP